MQSITNEGMIARRSRLGKVATVAGLGFLVAGLVVSFKLQETPWLWLSFLCLIVGLLVSSVGTFNMNRWVREPRADQALERGLKGFDNRYRLYNYYLPAPHVLLGPGGLFVLTAKGQDGVIRYEGGKFRRSFSLGRVLRFLGEEGMGRPFAEAEGEVQAIQRFLEERGAGEGIEVQNVVVFYNPRAELALSEPPQPVANPKGLKKAIRTQTDQKLPGKQYQQIRELFDAVAGL